MRLRLFGLVVLAAVAMGGCASPDATDSAGAPPSIASPSPSASPSTAPPVPSSSVPVATVTITGEVKDGVEPGCVLLNTGTVSYLLIGGDRSALVSGKRLTVVGVPQPGMMSTCQQGTPFRVVSIQS